MKQLSPEPVLKHKESMHKMVATADAYGEDLNNVISQETKMKHFVMNKNYELSKGNKKDEYGNSIRDSLDGKENSSDI